MLRTLILFFGLLKYSLCFAQQSNQPSNSALGLAAPKEMEIAGLERYANITGALGTVNLRWARSAEELFGRTPERAVIESMTGVKRALYSLFPSMKLLSNIKSWEIIFLDETLPVKQIPALLVSRCHPAWMTPPSNLYFVAQRIAAGCSNNSAHLSKSEADKELTKVVMHEIGHSIEFLLLGGQQNRDMVTAEGFATWFTSFASDYSVFFSKGTEQKKQLQLAKAALLQLSGRSFEGTEADYVIASLPFHLIQKQRRLSSLGALYGVLGQGKGLAVALEEVFGWNEKKLQSLMKGMLE